MVETDGVLLHQCLLSVCTHLVAHARQSVGRVANHGPATVTTYSSRF